MKENGCTVLSIRTKTPNLGAEIPNFLKDGNSLPGTLPLFPNWIDERK